MKKVNCLLLIVLLSFVTNSFAQTNNVKDNVIIFYITRHGKTILNTLEQAQGWADTPLTPSGIEVAKYLGLGLQAENIQFKSVYTSDLGRTRETARVVLDIKGQDIPITEVFGLREFCFGSYEGKPDSKMWGDIALYLHYKSMQDMMRDFSNKPYLMEKATTSLKELDTLGMAEDYPTVRARTQKALQEIAIKEVQTGGGNVLVVTHGMAIMALLKDLDSTGKISGGMIDNASVSKVIYKDGRFFVESVGDMSYVENGKEILSNNR
ncbi:MAG: histidine phosphatase family protein [Prevotella sp.]|jgi:probable phosphoglycerate mutase|nr:histidine phosphatase family protein [Prevotella sp.]